MFDFTKALQDAQKVTEQSSSGNKFQYKLLYPGEGTLSIRILFNPKSNSIIRKIIRHSVGNTKVPCMMNFGMNKSDCPICKAAESVYNMNGSVPKGMWAQVRGLCFVQFISASYKVEGINPGDIALLMVPKTMYEEIQSWIVNITSGDQGIQAMMSIFGSHECMEQSINRTSDNKYSFMMNPFKKFKSANSDEEFNKMLDELPDLNEQLVPAVLSEDVQKAIKAAEENIDQTYINAKVPTTPAAPTTPTGFTGGFVPQQSSAVNTNPTDAAVNTASATQTPAPATTPTAKPKPCFATYGKLQSGTDPVSIALKGLCGTCTYLDQCQKAENGEIPF